jgi:adenylate cyclase class 2
MLEIEMKFPDADFVRLRRRLKQWGARSGRALHEEDHYFNAPDRDFAVTDEALRLRRIGKHNVITYKGPKLAKTTKTRTEIEVPIGKGHAQAEDFIRVLTHLKYRPVGVVKKVRKLYTLQREGFPMEICLDEVAGLGRFAEVEIRAEEAKFAAARDVLLRTAAELGLTGEERRSYLELLLTPPSPPAPLPQRGEGRKRKR